MQPADRSRLASRRGPIAYVFDGRGPKPWLPRMTCDPGWVDLSGHERRRLCFRCAPAVSASGAGEIPTFWRDAPPADDERCLRGYGTRPPAGEAVQG